MTNKVGERIEKNLVSASSTLILGVGNILLSDEGVGVRVVEAMKDIKLPDNVELFDGGTGAFELFGVVVDRERVIIVDAVQGGGEPGTLYRFTPADIRVRKPVCTSLHQIGLMEVLPALEYLGGVPRDIIIFGIEPGKLSWGLELSAGVETVIPRVIELVLGEVNAPSPS